MAAQREKDDEIPATKKELPKGQECNQSEKTTVEDIPSRNNMDVEGTVPLPATSWRNRTIPGTIRKDDPLNEQKREEPLGFDVSTDGIISLCLHDRIRVDITVDRALRIMNFKSNIALAVSPTGSTAALLHPKGNVYQCGSRVEILAYDKHPNGNNKHAKMWYQGVSFTSDESALVYLVDPAGTRVTTDSFSDLSQDFTLHVFYNDSLHGPSHVQEARGLVRHSKYWVTNEGTDNWVLNNIHIAQTVDGLVRIRRNYGQYYLRTSSSNGSAGITTPFLHCTASLGETDHLFVRRDARRMYYSGTTFIVRNAAHSAGFDGNELKIY